MAYAILRVAKMKTMGNVGGHGSHVERQRETLNADPEKLKLNQRLAGSEDPVYDVKVRFDEAGVEPRKGAVVAIDVFITASPEHFQRNHPNDPNWQAFQAKAMTFLQKEYGAANVVHAMAHHDETSPHLHAIVTPIRSKTVKVGRKVKTERVENRLCAKDWLGGSRKTLSLLQTRFANSVKELGLERGIEGSKAKHTEVSQFYTLMQETTAQGRHLTAALAPLEAGYFVRSVPKPGLLEIAQPRQFAQDQVKRVLGSMTELIEQTNHNTDLARRNQLAQLPAPVTEALQQKGQTRQSQAEQALLQLGYRLDVHGQLVNVLEERKNALRATISRSVKQCADPGALAQDLAYKGIKMDFYSERQETYQGKTYNGVGFDDGQGRIWGHELGTDYTTLRLVEQLDQVQAQREQAEREQQYQLSFEQALAAIFQHHKGDAGKVAQDLAYTAKTNPTARQTYLRQFEKVHGVEGVAYARQQFARLDQMTALQLATEREALQKAGHEVGLGKGLKQGRSQ